jgi:hypothetical protein
MIKGMDGAAVIPGLHPSTLRGRTVKLGILRPELKSQIKLSALPQYIEVPPNIEGK